MREPTHKEQREWERQQERLAAAREAVEREWKAAYERWLKQQQEAGLLTS